MGTVNPDFSSKGAALGEPAQSNIGSNTGYTVTVTSANGPHTELVRKSDALASGSTVASHDFYAGDSTQTKVASIDVVIGGTDENSASMVLRTADAGVMSDGITISSGGTVTFGDVVLDSVTATTVDVTTLNATTANIVTTNTTTLNATLVSSTSVAATGVVATGVVSASTVSSDAATIGLVAATTVTISGGYANLTSTAGSGGVGVRLNAGTVEFKNTAGSWQAVAAATTTAGGWTDAGTYVHLTTGTDDVIVGAVATPAAKIESVDTADQLKLSNNSSTTIGTTFSVNTFGDLTLSTNGVIKAPANTMLSGALLGVDSYKSTWPDSKGELIKAIAKRTALSNIVDVCFIGSGSDANPWWRTNQGLSWWGEVFSATRGASKDVPHGMYAVLNTTGLYLYDSVTGALWMSYTGNASNHLRSSTLNKQVAYADGNIFVAANGNGLYRLDLANDRAWGYLSASGYVMRGTTVSRNSGLGNIVITTLANIVSDNVLSVYAKTINGKIFVIVGTSGGSTVLNVTDNVAYNSALTSAITAVAIDSSGYAVFRSGDSTYRSDKPVYAVAASWTATAFGLSSAGTVTKIAIAPGKSVISGGDVVALANQTNGLELVHVNTSDITNSAIQRHTKTYTAPTMYGAPAGAWPLNEDRSAGDGAVTDVSSAAFNLTSNGSPGFSKIGTGNDIDEYTFAKASSQYLTGTTTYTTNMFHFAAYVSIASASTNTIASVIGDGGSDQWYFGTTSSGYPIFRVSSDGTAFTTVTGSVSVCNGNRTKLEVDYSPSTHIRITGGGEQLAINTSSIPAALVATTAPFNIGGYNNTADLNGQVALPVYVKETISSAVVRSILLSELDMFVTGTSTWLSASSTVTAVGYDHVTNTLLVAQDDNSTGAGDTFSINNTRTGMVNSATVDDTNTALTSVRFRAASGGYGSGVFGTTADAYAYPIDPETIAVGERVKQVSSNITLPSGITKLLVTCGTTNITVGLPAIANNRNRVAEVWKVDSGVGVVILDGNGAETINGAATVSFATQWTYRNITAYGSGWLAK